MLKSLQVERAKVEQFLEIFRLEISHCSITLIRNISLFTDTKLAISVPIACNLL